MNERPATLAFVQARMSSTRFPGKVLAPFAGAPLIDRVIETVAEAAGADQVVVVTSTDPTDDPLAAHLDARRVAFFRGPRDDVLERFRLAMEAHPCEWILRICADSPLLDPDELRAVIAAADGSDADLVTTKTESGSPHGRNAELVRTEALQSLPSDELTPEDREHVTPFFYRNRDRFSIREIDVGPGRFPGERLTVDTIEDLRRLEALL
jgi:spore coat polysaccharide biosynthesis protein SpsF